MYFIVKSVLWLKIKIEAFYSVSSEPKTSLNNTQPVNINPLGTTNKPTISRSGTMIESGELLSISV